MSLKFLPLLLEGAPCKFPTVLSARKQVPRHSPTRCFVTTNRRQVYNELIDHKDTPTSGSAITTRVRKLDFPPFLKDLFLGKFNKSVLSYAEVLDYERHSHLEHKVGDIKKYMDGKKDVLEAVDRTGKLPPEIIHSFKQSGMFGLSIPAEYGGADFLSTEVARIFEEVGGVEMSLSEMMNYNEFLGGSQAILRHGTEAQKLKYLPLLASGEWTGSFCLHEEFAGSDADSVRCSAVQCDEDEDCYILTGKKTWVANAESSNLFTVFAKVNSKNYLGEDEKQMTAFLVDIGFGGVEVSSPYKMTGMKGLEACDVIFNNCKIPRSCVLGEPGQGLSVLQSIQHHHKYMVGAGVLAGLKTLLNESITHSNQRRQFGLPLSEFSLIKHQLARCAARLYCLESMIYFTAGLEDVSEVPDVELESVVVKQYAAETSDYVVKTCLSILGIDKVNMEDSRYQKYLRDSVMLQSWQGTANIQKCFIGVSGIIHLISQDGNDLKGLRQPALNPVKFLTNQFKQRRHRSDKYPLELKLSNCVHPRMVASAENLEWCILKLPFVTRELLMEQGANLQLEEKNLERLADMLIEIYAMTCALSRASRSYVVGHAHGEHEVNLTISYIHDARLRVKSKAWQCLGYSKDQAHRDSFWESAADYMTRRGGYQPVHPLTKNSF